MFVSPVSSDCWTSSNTHVVLTDSMLVHGNAELVK